MTKHTPGPWAIERTPKDFRIFHDGDGDRPGYGLIAIIPATAPIDEANAYQIVKTPNMRADRDRLREAAELHERELLLAQEETARVREVNAELLAALKGAASWIEVELEGESESSVHVQMLDEMRATIKRAE